MSASAPAAPSRLYLQAVLAGDRRRAFAVVDEARAGGLDVRSLYLEVFQPALRQIGELWERNQISVAIEHLATAITETAMARVYDQAFQETGAAGHSLLAACAQTERHAIGLRMVCDLLELAGWQTTYLGASVPADALARMAADLRPDVVALSATITPHVPQLRATIAALRAALPEQPPVIAVGGRPFLEHPDLAERIGADLTAPDAAQLVERLEERFA